MIEFTGFGKIPRLTRYCVITEKIDGTNAQVFITTATDDTECVIDSWEENGVKMAMYAGSRTRWITPENDNYGFARWVEKNAIELRKLGEGHHFGEWWGSGIQRGYGMKEKVFSLFNTSRWTPETAPSCCRIVPVLFNGIFRGAVAEECVETLKQTGSVAAPGFMQPEGIIFYHELGRCYFKKTILKDEEAKSKTEREV